MKRPHPRNPVALALYANAILLGGILIAILSRGNASLLNSSALAQNQAPIAGGAGVFVMPAQLATNQWGCYLMDIDAKTLVVYQYEPGIRQLRFVASRYFEYDRKLHDMSTSPPTEEVRRLVEKEKQGFRKVEENAVPKNPDAKD